MRSTLFAARYSTVARGPLPTAFAARLLEGLADLPALAFAVGVGRCPPLRLPCPARLAVGPQPGPSRLLLRAVRPRPVRRMFVGEGREAVHGARGEAEQAARALRRHDRMQQARRADDGIHWAGRQAAGAAYAGLGVDGDQDPWARASPLLPCGCLLREKPGKRKARHVPARRTTIDLRGPRQDRLGVGATAVEATEPTLGLG